MKKKVKESRKLSRLVIGVVPFSRVEKDKKKYTRKKKYKKRVIEDG